MNGALPPNSSENFLTVPAHYRISNLPTSVEPVKVSLRTVGFEVQLAADLVRPVGHAGKDTLRHAGALGHLTQVQPAGKAGPALRVIIAAGKFNGVIAAHTPTGFLLTTPYREYSEYRSARARPLGVDVGPLATPAMTCWAVLLVPLNRHQNTRSSLDSPFRPA
jgi:hypothetical protein